MKLIFPVFILMTTLSSFQLRTDLVPNEITAIKIAEAIWEPIYGEKIRWQKPFVAELQGDSVWIVHGTLPKAKVRNNVLYYPKPGVAQCYIRKKNGEILYVIHTR